MSDEIACSMCEGKGKIQSSSGFELVLQNDVKPLTPEELALVIGSSAYLAEARRFGIDPTKVKVSFDFGETKHHMCYRLKKSQKA